MCDSKKFATAVADFENWVIGGSDSGIEAVQNASIHLVTLYRLALSLKFSGTDDDINNESIERVDDTEYQKVLSKLSRIPFQYYGEVFDPLIIPPEEPVIGDITDDLADIYRDTVSALRAYNNGSTHEAVWYWLFCFNSHWADHATGGIRALDAYRREHLA